MKDQIHIINIIGLSIVLVLLSALVWFSNSNTEENTVIRSTPTHVPTTTPIPITLLPTITPFPTTVPICMALNSSDFMVNVRSGPGEDFEVIDVVRSGQAPVVIAKDHIGDWLKIYDEQGRDAWIFGALFELVHNCANLPVK